MKSRTHAARSGFTLVEMIVATLLLAIGVVGAIAAVSSGIQASYQADRLQTAALLAERKLAQIELESSNLTGGDQDGDFGKLYSEFHWHESVEATNYPDLFQVTLTIQWDMNNPRPSQRQYVTYLRNPQDTPQSTTGTYSSASSSTSTTTSGSGSTTGAGAGTGQ
jgi:prepilin-type N-terminal cleavage/methylation domain-containing protein